eukprot:TRINITY_DN11015_c0_g1_i1.p1 TRINITY_DN11015_c0_g1~~TRINITY_DN11015_c0_g1_i1.p1  ORF type:complete len:809 (+),score=210.29 TRINITY_DN11015_c0_g1_i1:219-2645(+)
MVSFEVESMPVFEGPEKTLSICFKSSHLAVGSLRLIPREAWSAVLKHANCEILSVVETSPAQLAPSKKGSKRMSTKGLTGYLLSESSLFLSDNMLTLKTCGQTTPLAALEPILDLVSPDWQKQKYAGSYVKHLSYTRLGYMFPEQQVKPHTSWEEEVGHLNKHFHGDAAVLGSENQSQYHVYVANYLGKNDITDVFTTQVALTGLHTDESMVRFVKDRAVETSPLGAAWKPLHGDSERSIAAKKELDELFFEPIGYSANAVFGKHFTTVHATPQPSCSYVSVETSAPLSKEARGNFAVGALEMCRGRNVHVSEFALSSMLLSGEAPSIPGYRLMQSSKTVGVSFGVALHYYEADTFGSPSLSFMSSPRLTTSPSSPVCSCHSEGGLEELQLVELLEAEEVNSTKQRLIQVKTVESAALEAAKAFNMETAQVDTDKPVVLLDLGALKRQAKEWRTLLPRVEPFYAAKCNPDPAIVRALWNIWLDEGVGGYDCASPSEMDIVMALGGVDPAKKIIYANPCKQVSAVLHAKSVGVKRMTFDNMAELDKIKNLYPEAELVLRVQTDDSLCQCPLSNKFGAPVEGCRELLQRAKELGLEVVGVSFHVGSGCSQVGAFRSALVRAKAAFDEAERMGYKPTLLDIGGGFPGWDEDGSATFAEHAADIAPLLEELFPSNIQVIAEPGRYFAAQAVSLLTTVIAVNDCAAGQRYYLNDGVYGSFNCLVYDHASVPEPIVLRGGEELIQQSGAQGLPCTVFGPTCDGFDMISDKLCLPRLQVGDQLLFRNMGAYTSAASTTFNGFAPAQAFVYESSVQ